MKKYIEGTTKLIRRHLKASATLALVLMVSAGVALTPLVRADPSLQEQINQLNAQNDKTQGSVDQLQLQANSYQDAINKLNAEIAAINAAIAAGQAKQADLQRQIDADQVKLDAQKAMLGEDLKAMYVSGDMSTVEMLASSKDLSSFVDAETYRSAVQKKIQNTLKEITDLQNQLKAQKQEVDQLVEQQKNQQQRLAEDQAAHRQLLSLNQQQQDAYNSQIAANKKKIGALEAEQARINALNSRTVSGLPPSGGSGGACDIGMGNGGYPMPWCNSPQDTIPTISYSSDPINRECTSFAYWYFTAMEGKSLHVTGDAKNWAYTANRPVTHTPHVGDIFVNTSGPYGHVGIVVAIDGGWVRTISMNDDYNGHFYNNREYPINSLYYIN